MTSTAIVDGLARLLDAEDVATYSPDSVLPAGSTPIGIGAPPASGDTAMCLTTYPGPEPNSRNGWEYPRLQVRVRAPDALAALALDRAAYDVLQQYAGTLPGGHWLVDDCYALQSEPGALGIDANGRHEYARNYQLTAGRTGGSTP